MPSVGDHRRALKEQLRHVEAELAERRGRTTVGDDTSGGAGPGFGKRAGDYVAQVVEDRTNNQLVDALAATATAIRGALTRLDDGGFGLCARCGGPIGDERLAAVPWTTLCRACVTDTGAAAATRARLRGGFADRPSLG